MGYSCVLNEIPSARASLELQNSRLGTASSRTFFERSDHWIGDFFASSQSRFVEPTSSACNFAVAAPFCAPSVPVHSWIPDIYIFVLVFLLCSRQVYFLRRKCYVLHIMVLH
ncbi:uncharacterized protein M6B38_212715 [Iris pallida]|uniref:Uncharacterized protein n=1 Tax=Iris pallida TaxID=29817 RepID=A0AAX6E4D7_IRIPA|nr:uncharacterized protein M6B38_212715 [Iris pallida]